MSGAEECGDAERKAGDQKSDHEQRYASEELAWTGGGSPPPTPPSGNGEAGRPNNEPEPPNWVEKWTFIVVVIALVVAAVAAYEADRLARDTEVALEDARNAARQSHIDSVNAEINTANALGQAQANANQTHTDNLNALQIARDANTGTADAAKIQERLTRESNRINKDAFTTVQRAFVVVDSLGEVRMPDNSTFFFPFIQNAGDTPADISAMIQITPRTEWRARMSLWLSASDRLEYDIGAPLDPDDVLVAAGPETRDLILKDFDLGPKGTIQPREMAGAERLTAQDLQDTFTGKVGRFFFGEIKYVDQFGAGHVTKYCFRTDTVHFENGQATPATPARCSHWNCTDSQCKADKTAYGADLAAALQKQRH
jgi:hypothetical protein